MMISVGLIPPDTGAPGGWQVGQKVSHYIQDGGPFARACATLIAKGFDPLYVELWSDGEAEKRKKKSTSKPASPARIVRPTHGPNPPPT